MKNLVSPLLKPLPAPALTTPLSAHEALTSRVAP